MYITLFILFYCGTIFSFQGLCNRQQTEDILARGGEMHYAWQIVPVR